ncbi:hypothetical protein [Solitalea canadensis]|uniref:Uncharacterized protein n=1 Tax=Solitalea canadensis (strain ATCC 29591 / DSM 3403 / JCM 21819 / LMG 8368 / NBRC 15130 / NCIMB 12057 / USAM 9D) TaxID=929556 RepID=H8KV82_SOLCM|nr:hypothetical protein [Solitalea canadensis]AFD06140.1 hypothetical protein Solca_1032 [Solitalea canadensis DSM 3403]
MRKPNYIYLLITLFFLFTNCKNASAQNGEWVKGHYYTWSGERVEGFLKHRFQAQFGSGPDNSLRFMVDRDAKRITLTTKDVKSFVLQIERGKVDSFIVIKNFTINVFATYREDFVKVVATGPLNLYMHYSTVSTGSKYGVTTSPVSNWLVQKGESLTLIKNQSNFKEVMPQLVSDDTELVEKITNKEFKYRDIEEVIRLYNQKHLTSLN